MYTFILLILTCWLRSYSSQLKPISLRSVSLPLPLPPFNTDSTSSCIMDKLDRTSIIFTAPGVRRILETNEYVTGHMALEMLLRSDLSNSQTLASGPIKILDNASGAGVLPDVILQLRSKDLLRQDIEIIAADHDETYIKEMQARQSVSDKSLGWDDVEIKQFDMQVGQTGLEFSAASIFTLICTVCLSLRTLMQLLLLGLISVPSLRRRHL